MKVNDVVSIIRAEVNRRGYKLEERKSVSTDSLYFKIYSGDTSLMFRLSDHQTKSNIMTLRVDKKTTAQSVRGFINNRCQDLSHRHVKALLGL